MSELVITGLEAGIDGKSILLSPRVSIETQMAIGSDNSLFITESIKEVIKTLSAAVVIVIVVIFLFLGVLLEARKFFGRCDDHLAALFGNLGRFGRQLVGLPGVVGVLLDGRAEFLHRCSRLLQDRKSVV